MKPRKELKLVLGIAILFATATAWISRTTLLGSGFVETVILVKIFLTSFSMIALTGLVVNYFRIYTEMPTSTSKTLLIFSAALLFYSVSANPLVQVLFGFQVITVGPFTYLPDLFATAASIAILYESYR